MEIFSEYLLFLAKTVTGVVAIGVVIMLFSNLSRGKRQEKGHIEVVSLNEKIEAMSDFVGDAILSESDRKAAVKARKQALKSKRKSSADSPKKRIFVLDFHGDIRASAVAGLREEITAVLAQARAEDEVLLRLESSGGMVPHYGLAASQLDRVKRQGVPLTVSIDKFAASGGYMMACVGEKIIAAPFAMIGSIGVVAQVPNIHRLLKKHDVDVDVLTAGKYKRTLTVLGENTEEGRDKFIEDLEDAHALFKDFVAEHRGDIDIDAVATGEVWYGARAQGQGLVDGICTSDQYLCDQLSEASIYSVTYVHKKSVSERLGEMMAASGDRFVLRWLQRLLAPSQYK